MAIPLKTIKGACPLDCPDTCGFITTIEGDRALQLKGDPDHPFTQGALCAKVNHYLERVYHKERILYPLKRIGRKGSGQFQRVSWEQALREIGSRFREIIAQYGAQAILPYSYAGTLGKVQGSSLDRRFFHRLGASLLDRTICATAGAYGCDITLGTRAVMDPESVIHAKYIINWGSNTSVTNMHFWALIHQAKKRGAKVVTIDPHKSPTAQKSDWWLGIRPGTDAALALGMMHIIFREGWEDHDYLERYCLGTKALKERVLREYSPNRVASITGLSVDSIETLTREYAHSQKQRGGPAFIRLNYGMQRHGGGGMAVRTVCCLPALTGDWRFSGGGALLSTSKLFPWNTAALERPDLIPPGTRTINMVQLADALHGEIPGPPLKALVVYAANPVVSNPHSEKVRRGLLQDDFFLVVHEQIMTDTAEYADFILPCTSQLEHFDVHNGYGHLYVQANNPAIPPQGEAVPNTEFFRRLAREMNFEPELFDMSDEQLAELALSPLGSSNGYPSSAAFEGITLDALKRGPVRLRLPAGYAPFAHGNFGTPSGKCEFYSEREKLAGRDPLPFYQPPHEDPQTQPDLAAKYPLQMVCPPPSQFLNSMFVELDSLRNKLGSPTLEIHPIDAAKRGISDGDWVRIFNDRGEFEAKAKVRESVSAGVVVTLGVWSQRLLGKPNCNATTSTAITDLGGGGTFFDNLVQVESI